MIAFEQVTKGYATGGGRRHVLRDVTCRFVRGRNLGVLGANGAGKSTLLRLLAGAELPDSGRIRREGRISFPLGFTGVFHAHLTGRQNATFVARVYGEHVARTVGLVAEFAELGAYFDMPLRTYSAGMHARFAFGVSLAIDFDIYLVDETLEVGDERFRAKCVDALSARMARSDIILVSHNPLTVRNYCDAAAVLHDGALTFYDNVEDAFLAYRQPAAAHA